jgi:nucleoside-specific outer membrane channel protein Tsx
MTDQQNKLNTINSWGSPLAIPGFKKHCVALLTAMFVFSFAGTNAYADDAPPPPERANQMASFTPFSTTDIQALYGTRFREPGVGGSVIKRTVTLENSAAWSWGASYFFVDYLRSNPADQNSTEFYAEWYPSASISRITGASAKVLPLKDILITMGVNMGTKNSGASPLVFLPGLTFDLKVPYFQFFSVGIYAYVDKGRFNNEGNGCNSTTYQITPSWSLPFHIGSASFRFDGFIDYIGSHRQCAHQIISQPTVKLDIGNFRGKPNRLFAGVEYSYWKNKYGISNLNQTAPQAVVMWVF